MQNRNEWLTLSEAQALLGVSRKTLYRYMDKQLLSYTKAANGRRYLYRYELHRFLDKSPNLSTNQLNASQQNKKRPTMIQIYGNYSQNSALKSTGIISCWRL